MHAGQGTQVPPTQGTPACGTAVAKAKSMHKPQRNTCVFSNPSRERDTLPRLALSPEKAAGEQAIRGDGVDSAEQLLAKAVGIYAATGQKPSREQVLLAALKLGIGFYGIDSFRASAEKLPFSWELDRAARDAQDRPHPHGAKNGRQLQLEI